MDQAPVFLLRSPREPAATDPYSSAFASAPRYRAHHLPVLETSFLNLAQLSSIIEGGADGCYAGVIITSVRSAEAWTLASQSTRSDWSNVPFFVVGPATKDAVHVMTATGANGDVTSDVSMARTRNIVIGAKETGSGEKLGQFIVDYFPSPSTLPLLYLVGDKNRDTIRRILTGALIPLTSLQVYETHPAPDFESQLDLLLLSIRHPASDSGERPSRLCWFVLFSPSGSKPCFDALRKRGMLDSIEDGGRRCENADVIVRFAVIGPTTKEYAEVDEKIVVDADARSPDPNALVRAIEEVDSRRKVA